MAGSRSWWPQHWPPRTRRSAFPSVTNPLVPSRVRRLITVESGLNDGIVTPVVLIAIAGAATVESTDISIGLGPAFAQLAGGALVGVAIGIAGGYLLRLTRRKGWIAEDFAGVAVLALALVAYILALVVGGNGFVAAFCGGLAFGASAGRRGPSELVFLEQATGLVSLLVWLAFGAVAIPMLLDRMSPVILLYAVLSLTVVRMLPVAIAAIGSGLDRNTILFVGWFGPRGLASLVFALLALEELGQSEAALAVTIIAATVVLSVVAHGATAAPLASRYGKAAATRGPEPGGVVADIAVRGLPRRTPACRQGTFGVKVERLASPAHPDARLLAPLDGGPAQPAFSASGAADASLIGERMISTGQCACSAHVALTEPSSKPMNPP